MSSTVKRLFERGLVKPPSFVPNDTQYETITGSVAYGVSGDTSDMDVVGFCIPPKEIVFPHLAGEISGFGTPRPRFEQFEAHHVADEEARKRYDLTVFGVVKFFRLCMENNPNMVDTLYTPDFCVLHATAVGRMVRERREVFLHKGAYQKFKGYAYAQLHKMETRRPVGKRRETVERYGFDVKFAYHVVRLLGEVEQILTTGTLDLQRNREQLKAIRRGEVPAAEIRRMFAEKERDLERLYHESPLPYGPREAEIRQLLLDCLEHHYGSLESAVVSGDRYERAVREIQAILDAIPDRR
jgi:predicted nucleotidyltransferase